MSPLFVAATFAADRTIYNSSRSRNVQRFAHLKEPHSQRLRFFSGPSGGITRRWANAAATKERRHAKGVAVRPRTASRDPSVRRSFKQIGRSDTQCDRRHDQNSSACDLFKTWLWIQIRADSGAGRAPHRLTLRKVIVMTASLIIVALELGGRFPLRLQCPRSNFTASPNTGSPLCA